MSVERDMELSQLDYNSVIKPFLMNMGFSAGSEGTKPVHQVGWGTAYSNVPLEADPSTGIIVHNYNRLNQEMSNILDSSDEKFFIQAYLDRKGGRVLECMVSDIRVLYNIYVQDDGVFPEIGLKQNKRSGKWFITIPFTTIVDICSPLGSPYWWFKTDGTVSCNYKPAMLV